MITIPHARPASAGIRRPRRSAARPTIGATIASSAAATRKHAAMMAAPAPKSSSRSGPRTFTVPNRRPGTITSHPPRRTRPSRAASASWRNRGGAVGARAGVRTAQSISPTPTTPTPQNTGSGPIAAAAAPSTGPNSEPTIAAPIAEPISSPRRWLGASPISQPSAPAHDIAPPTPWTKRAASSTTTLSANAKATLDADMTPRPSNAVGRTPARAASQPPGSAPANVPAG
jgi:hypothetical protein